MKKLLIPFLVLIISLNISSQNGRNGPSLWEEIRANSNLNYDNTKPQIIEALKKYDSHPVSYTHLTLPTMDSV